jgi:RAB protein geranylgeranyltransferase component A
MDSLRVADDGVRRFIEQNRTATIGKLLHQWNREIAIKELSVEKGRFKVKHQALALRSYEIFWETLVLEQRERGQNDPLNAIIIHSSSWAVWTRYAVKDKLLASQRSFCENGGKVTRILCARGKEPNEEVRQAARDMKKAGIHILYCDIDSAMVNFDFSWDFVYVKETQQAVVWESFNPNGEIKVSTYQIGDRIEGTFGKFEDLWEDIRRDSLEWDEGWIPSEDSNVNNDHN